MIYAYWYLGIGAVFLAVIFISYRLTKSPNEDRINDLLIDADPRRNQWWWKPLNNFIVPILAAVMVLTMWPIAIYWKAKKIIEARQHKNEKSHKEFAVNREHLQKQWSVAEIEIAEVVVDPLGAAPRLPFGHLNPAWENFKNSIEDGDQLWSFSAQWTTEWGRNEVRDGYVVFRGESIGPHFLTRWVFIDKENELGEG